MDALTTGLSFFSLRSSETEKSSAEATPSGGVQPSSSAPSHVLGPSVAGKSSAEATPSGVLQPPSTTTTRSSVAEKSSAEATPSGVQKSPAAAAPKKKDASRSGAGRGKKPARHRCPHCNKWGQHRPEDCTARPSGPSVVNHFTVMAGATVQAGAVTSGRVVKKTTKKKKPKKGAETKKAQKGN